MDASSKTENYRPAKLYQRCFDTAAVRHGDFLFTQDNGRDMRRAFWLAAVNSQKETGSGRRAWEITGNHSADKEKTV